MPPELLTGLASSGIGFLGGAIQSIIGGSREKKALNALEALKTPTYTSNRSINDYYNEAKQRYNVNPYQSQQYQMDAQNAGRATAAGLGALQDRRSAIGGVGRLAAIQNNAMLQAGVNAENQQNQRFGQLGQAVGMKSADDQYGFQVNQMMPYDKQMQLLGLKASGGAQILNSGLSNMFNGLSNAGMVASDYYMNRQPKAYNYNRYGSSGAAQGQDTFMG